jgi:hypothetical protein
LKTSQGYIIRILQHFATKLWNITNFAMLFQAVMKFLSRLVEFKSLVNWGMVHCFRNFPPRLENGCIIISIPKGGVEQANNNRRISLLPILSKVCERTMHDQMIPYLDTKQRLMSIYPAEWQ